MMKKCWCGRNHNHWYWICDFIYEDLICYCCDGWGTEEDEPLCDICFNTCITPISLSEFYENV